MLPTDGQLHFCLSWPKAMSGLLSVAAVLALDPVKETKLPCAFVAFDYFVTVKLVIIVPLALTAAASTLPPTHAARAKKRHHRVAALLPACCCATGSRAAPRSALRLRARWLLRLCLCPRPRYGIATA